MVYFVPPTGVCPIYISTTHHSSLFYIPSKYPLSRLTTHYIRLCFRGYPVPTPSIFSADGEYADAWPGVYWPSAFRRKPSATCTRTTTDAARGGRQLHPAFLLRFATRMVLKADPLLVSQAKEGGVPMRSLGGTGSFRVYSCVDFPYHWVGNVFHGYCTARIWPQNVGG